MSRGLNPSVGDQPLRAASAAEFKRRKDFRAFRSSLSRRTGSAHIPGLGLLEVAGSVVSGTRRGNFDTDQSESAPL
jgi:hypothetical protein